MAAVRMLFNIDDLPLLGAGRVQAYDCKPTIVRRNKGSCAKEQGD